MTPNLTDWDKTSYPGEWRRSLYGHQLRYYPAREEYHYRGTVYSATGMDAHIARMLRIGAPTPKDALFVHLYESGLSAREAASRVGLPYNTASERLRRFGVSRSQYGSQADRIRDYLRQHGPSPACVMSEALGFNVTRGYQNVLDVRRVGSPPRPDRKSSPVLALSGPREARPRSGRRTVTSHLQGLWK